MFLVALRLLFKPCCGESSADYFLALFVLFHNVLDSRDFIGDLGCIRDIDKLRWVAIDYFEGAHVCS